MEIIAFTQSKGGQAKTTSCFEFAAGLSLRDKQVLCIDMDSQGNLSIIANADRRLGIYDVLTENKELDDVIQPFAYGDIVTSNDEMSMFDFEMGAEQKKDGLFRLYDAIQNLSEDYDYVLIDCPPQLGFSTMNAMMAADRLVVPMTCDEFSVHGIVNLNDTMSYIRQDNERLHVAGILITRYSPRALIHQQMEKELREVAEELGMPVYQTAIRENVRIKNAHYERKSIQQYDKRSNSARDYSDAVDEFLQSTQESK